MTTTQTPMMIGARYQVGEALGLGAGSDVLRGEDTVLHRPVAIKIAAPEHSATYRAALGATARISHPAFVGIFDSLYHENRLVIVQEYVAGQRFADLAAAALPPQDIARLGQDIALALAHAHRQGVVHGDLTPTAIFRDQWGAVRINNLLLPPDQGYFAGAARILAGADRPWDATPTIQGDLRAVGALLWLLLARRDTPPVEAGGADDWTLIGHEVPDTLQKIIADLLVPTSPPAFETAEDLTLALRTCARSLRSARSLAPKAPPWESPRDSLIGVAPPPRVDLPDMIATIPTPAAPELPLHRHDAEPLLGYDDDAPNPGDITWPDEAPRHPSLASQRPPSPARPAIDIALWVGLAVALFLFWLVVGFFVPGLLGR